MSDDEIRVAIAEKCGWLGPFGLYRRIASGKQILGGSGTLHGTPPCDKEKPKDDQAYEPVPDYPNDLNACHEFWLQFSLEEKVGYAEHLHFVVARDYNATQAETGAFSVLYKMVQCALMVGATDHQRCEAFLRAHGLWKDNPTPERSESK